MGQPARLEGTAARAMGPTGITAGGGVQARELDGGTGLGRVSHQQGLGEVLGLGLAQGLDLAPVMDMGLEVVELMVEGMVLEVGLAILLAVVMVEEAVVRGDTYQTAVAKDRQVLFWRLVSPWQDMVSFHIVCNL